MSLDLSKLHDAIGKVADLAKSHASVSALVATANTARVAAETALAQAQKDVDALVAQLLGAATTPAEAAGITAVAAALTPPASPVIAPVIPAAIPVAIPNAAVPAPVAQTVGVVVPAPVVAPVAPVAPVSPSPAPLVAPAAPLVTPVAPAVAPVAPVAPLTVDQLNAQIAAHNAGKA